MHTLTQIIKRHLRHILLTLSLVLGSQAAQAGVPTIDGATLGQSTMTAIATMKSQLEAAAQYLKQIEQWQKEYTQYMDKFRQAAAGDFGGLLSSYTAGNTTKSQEEMDKFVQEYQASGNERCNRMTQVAIKALCTRKLSYQVLKLKTLAKMMDETEDQDKKIQAAIKKGDSIDGSSDAEKKKTALMEIAAMQNRLQAIVTQRVNEMQTYDKQINGIKGMQAEVARTVMQGKSGGLADTAIAAAALKLAFTAAQH